MLDAYAQAVAQSAMLLCMPSPVFAVMAVWFVLDASNTASCCSVSHAVLSARS